jgi:uncharacterized membrane protein YhaH (DUF805 family)
MHVDIPRLYLSLSGRIGRGQFWVGALGVIVLSLALSAALGSALGVLWGNFLTALVNAYPSYAVLAKRFHDLDQPGVYGSIPVGLSVVSSLLGVLGLTGPPAAPNIFGFMLGVIAIFVALWVLITCGMVRGTRGGNAYGPDPKAKKESPVASDDQYDEQYDEDQYDQAQYDDDRDDEERYREEQYGEERYGDDRYDGDDRYSRS